MVTDRTSLGQDSNFREADGYMIDLCSQYQSTLIYSCLENFNVVDAMGGYAGGQYAKDNSLWWAASVEFLYRNLKSGLLEVDTCPDGLSYEGPENLCRHYMNLGPSQNDRSMYIYFVASKALMQLVSKYSMMDWKCVNTRLNRAFFEVVLHIYAEGDVEFNKKLLLSS
ncbi:hypothetical protein [Aliidiomarina soli]|uniref:Uncharacterized protein n=1 Tax=Aliidiomarina soli TaxID=1928574 RepID=A0A432WE36_9GAMM|nr:hypothetical protein [Aliidiomarina soli]RUO31144.1 hypothetical protein CWE14_11655 [Aliidiomarina soli]